MSTRSFGQRISRNEDPRLLTGQALFVDDVRLPADAVLPEVVGDAGIAIDPNAGTNGDGMLSPAEKQKLDGRRDAVLHRELQRHREDHRPCDRRGAADAACAPAPP